MGFQIVDDVAEANAVTHGGTFHADEVFACVVLARCMDVKLVRVLSVPDDLPKNVLVFDIGGGKYDHHQSDKAVRANGVPYAAFGLIWKDYGKRFLSELGCPDGYLNRVFSVLEKKFVVGMDAYDNGVNWNEGQGTEKGLSLVMGLYNPTWLESGGANRAFTQAVQVADTVLTRMALNYIAGVRAEDALETAIKESTSHYLVLNKYLPWKGVLLSSKQPKAAEIWYVIYPSNRGGYCCQCVPAGVDTFEQRHPVPEQWRGNPKATGVEDCVFVHQTGFLATMKTLEGALEYVTRALGDEA